MHIGQRIREIFDSKPKQYTITWLANKLNCSRRNVYRIFERNNIDIILLKQISEALEYDFFKDLSSTK